MPGLGTVNRLETATLFLGDVVIFYISLWLALGLRTLSVPSIDTWRSHVAPFTILFLVWVLVFFIAGLYEKHTTLLKSRLPIVVLQAQVVNGALAILFFFVILHTASQKCGSFT